MFVEVAAVICVLLCARFIFWYKSSPTYRISKFPTSPGVFLLGHTPYLSDTSKPIPFINEQLKKNNGFFQISVGPKILLATSDYDFIEWILRSTTHINKSEQYDLFKEWLGNGLLTSLGSCWKFQRRIITPAFHFQMVEKHINSLERSSTILVQKLKQYLDQDDIDVYPFISNFTLDAICESAMATSVNAQINDESDYATAVRHICRISVERAFNLFKLFPITFRFHSDFKLLYESIDLTHKFNISVIRERRQMLQRKLANKSSSENVYERKEKVPFLDVLLSARRENGEALTDKEIKDEVNTFMFAGHETTASTISFTLYNLARYRDVQNKAFEEQKDLFTEENTEITYSLLSKMKYLEMVIKETLRIYPTVPLIARKIDEDTFYKGKFLPEGLTIMISLFTLHRNPKIFPEPEKFDPSRFENDSKLPPYSFIPFSAGPRNCIGQRFAMVEIKQILSKILRNFEILPSTPSSDIKLTVEATLKSTNGIHVKLRKREH